MELELDIQRAVALPGMPTDAQLQHWAEAALQGRRERAEVSLRITDEDEIQELNHRYRHQNKATNVLSFPADLPPELGIPLLGDVVVCAAVVAREAQQQEKSLEAHWAHMVVHGILHLLGYDHISEVQAQQMEALESGILLNLGYTDPYLGH